LKVKNYHLAGLDFIFDKNYKPWFIEANSKPGFISIKKIFGNIDILKPILDKLQSKENPTLMFQKIDKENLWVIDEILKDYDFHVCFAEDNNKNSRSLSLIDRKKKHIKPGSILRYGSLSRVFERNNILVINPNTVANLTYNKIRTYQMLSKAKIKLPKTYVVYNNAELKRLLEQENDVFEKGFVIKPLANENGNGVHILKNHNGILPTIKEGEMLEQLIVPKKYKHRFWDVRVYVIEGKLVSGVIRSSKSPITNIMRGAKPERLPDNLLKKLKKPAEDIVKILDKEAEMLKKTFY
jgi:glutathione synthase/RimK-type ligase-like ATP-grasp enzyme